MQLRMPLAIFIALFVLATLAHAQGTIVNEQFYSTALDSDQDLRIYLPDGYDPVLNGRYPVVYFLHGANSNANDPAYDFVFEILDDLIGQTNPNEVIRPIVLVMPDGSAPPFAGSMWANSELYGQFEDYVVQDLQQFIEANYNVRPDRDGRAITGYSMGGIGCMSIAFTYPEKFAAVASNSGALDFSGLPDAFFSPMLAEHGGWPPYNFIPYSGTFSYLTFTAAGGYSPNPETPPYQLDIPLNSDGNLRPDVFARWLEHDPATLAASVTPGGLGIYFNCGTADELNFLPLNEGFAAKLTDLGHQFTYETDGGGHFTSERVQRVKSSLLFIDGYFSNTVGIEEQVIFEETPQKMVTSLQGNIPNPFNPATTINFQLAHTQQATLSIHDLSGRRVALLKDGVMSEGEHSHLWRGCDSVGRQVPSGTYIVRLVTKEKIATSKLQLIR